MRGSAATGEEAPSGLRVAQRRHGALRLGFFRAVERACRLLGGRRLYRAFHLARGRFVVREELVTVAGLPRGLEGFCIAHLTDFHAGPFLRGGDLGAVVDAVNALAPDLVALTGDYVTRHWSEALALTGDFAALRSRYGTLAVFGNHDYKGRLEGRIADAYAAAGVRFLRNACARIDTGAGVLAVVGLEDLEEGRTVDLAAARAGLRPDDVELVLCHNPHGASGIARPGCVAILSGHTHGTQIDLPLLRTLGPRHPGLRLACGDTALIVSRGLGVVGLPWRYRAPAELVVVRLQRALEGG